jgi:hypothetical protein
MMGRNETKAMPGSWSVWRCRAYSEVGRGAGSREARPGGLGPGSGNDKSQGCYDVCKREGVRREYRAGGGTVVVSKPAC